MTTASPSSRRSRQPRRVMIIATSMALILSPSYALAAPAPTDQRGSGDPQGGLWYVSQMGIDKAHADGYTGEGVTIAVLDGQINPSVAEFAGADLQVHEPSYCYQTDGQPFPAQATNAPMSHGTGVTAAILGNGQGNNGEPGTVGIAPGATVKYYAAALSIGEYGDWKDDSMDRALACARPSALDDAVSGITPALVEAIDDAVADGADIISLSFTANYQSEGETPFVEAIARAQRAGVIVVGAVGNERPLRGVGVMNGNVGVQASDAGGKLLIPLGDTGPISSDRIDVVAPGVDILLPASGADHTWAGHEQRTGTSIAAPLVAGALAVLKSKYPEATPSQLIQGLVRNTDTTDHQLYYDTDKYWGYGPVNIAHMLENDPSTYPDENPLIVDTPEAIPSAAELRGSASPTPEHSAPESDTPTNSETSPAVAPVASTNDSSPILWILLGGGLVALVVAGVIALMARNRKREKGPAIQYAPGYGTQPPPAGNWPPAPPTPPTGDGSQTWEGN